MNSNMCISASGNTKKKCVIPRIVVKVRYADVFVRWRKCKVLCAFPLAEIRSGQRIVSFLIPNTSTTYTGNTDLVFLWSKVVHRKTILNNNTLLCYSSVHECTRFPTWLFVFVFCCCCCLEHHWWCQDALHFMTLLCCNTYGWCGPNLKFICWNLRFYNILIPWYI